MPSPTDIERAREEAVAAASTRHLYEGLSVRRLVSEVVAPILEAPWRAEVEALRLALVSCAVGLHVYRCGDDGGSFENCPTPMCVEARSLLAQPVPTAPRAEEGT